MEIHLRRAWGDGGAPGGGGVGERAGLAARHPCVRQQEEEEELQPLKSTIIKQNIVTARLVVRDFFAERTRRVDGKILVYVSAILLYYCCTAELLL